MHYIHKLYTNNIIHKVYFMPYMVFHIVPYLFHIWLENIYSDVQYYLRIDYHNIFINIVKSSMNYS